MLSTTRGRVIAFVVIAAVVGGTVLVRNATAAPPPVALRTAPVARGSVTQTVAVSGSINASAQIRLNFKQSGRLAEVLVSVGDQVAKDQALARLDLTDLQIALTTAQAGVASAGAKYDQTAAGSSAEDIAIAQRSLDKVKTGYASAKNAYQSNATGTQFDTRGVFDRLPAVRDQITTVLGNLTPIAQPVATMQPPTTEAPSLTPEPTLGTAKTDARAAIAAMNQAQAARDSAEAIANDSLTAAFGEWNGAYTGVRASIAAFDAAVSANADGTQAATFYQASQSTYTTAASKFTNAIDSVAAQLTTAQTNLQTAMNSLQTGGSRNENNLDKARVNLGTAQASFVSLQQLLSGVKSKVAAAGTALATITDTIGGTYLSSQASFQKTAAGPKSYELQGALAAVQSAQAALQTAQNNLDNATLKAPGAGTIASIGGQVGEFVAGGGTNNPFMVIANIQTMQLHGTVGEADVAKLRLGQVANVTIDAVGNVSQMTGKVSSIDPVATIQQGVPVYGVDTVIDIPAAGVRPGMTGTAAVIIAAHQNVITVPNLAIRAQGTRRYVQTLRDGAAVDTDVVFGIANDSVTEVTSGLADGDVVVLPQPRAGASVRPQGFGGAPGGGSPPGVGR